MVMENEFSRRTRGGAVYSASAACTSTMKAVELMTGMQLAYPMPSETWQSSPTGTPNWPCSPKVMLKEKLGCGGKNSFQVYVQV